MNRNRHDAPSPSLSRAAAERAPAQGGATLAGLLAALVVLAILAAVAVSRRNDLRPDAFSDAQILKAALRFARTRALADNVPWSFTVAGQAGTIRRNGADRDTVAFATSGVAAGSTQFNNRGQASGTLSYAVTDFAQSPVTVVAGTGFTP